MDILKYIPNAVLTTVVIVNLINVLKKFKDIPKLRKSSPTDYWSSIITTVVLILFGAEASLFTGIIASLIILLLGLRQSKKTLPCDALDSSDQTVIYADKTIHFLNRDKLVDKVEKIIHHARAIIIM